MESRGMLGGAAFLLSLGEWLVIALSLNPTTGAMPMHLLDLPGLALGLLGVGGVLGLVAAIINNGRIGGFVAVFFSLVPFLRYH